MEPKIFDHTPRQKTLQENRRHQLRFFLAVLLTNTFVFLCTLFFNAKTEFNHEITPRDGHTLLIVPLKSFVPHGQGDRKISLFNSSGELVLLRAYLLESKSSLMTYDGLQYLIEVQDQDLPRLIPYQNETLTAHPFSLDHQKLKSPPTQIKERKNYELIF